MITDWEHYNFYSALEIDSDAGADEIKKAHQLLTASLDPDAEPEEGKRSAALAFIVSDAALEALTDDESRKNYDAKLDEARKAASAREKLEAKRMGKLQEEQSIEEDAKFQKATLRSESAKSALADFYYDRLFKRAKDIRFDTIPNETLMEWLNAERAELIRKAEQKGRKTSFQIDWQGFANVQEKRKERSEEIARIVEGLVERFQLS